MYFKKPDIDFIFYFQSDFNTLSPIPEQLVQQLDRRFGHYLVGDGDLTYVTASMIDPLMSQYLSPFLYDIGKKAVERLVCGIFLLLHYTVTSSKIFLF